LTVAGIPEGVTASFSNVRANTNTATFDMPKAFVVITFNPADVNYPGTLTLYDSGNNVILTMLRSGHTSYQVPLGGASYYFSSTADIASVAMTIPNGMR
jgi:hypothetical protein